MPVSHRRRVDRLISAAWRRLRQRVVQPLHLRPLIGNVDEGAVFIFDGATAGFRQRVQDRIQLGTDGVGESAGEMPHAVAALLQLQIPAVLLQLIIDGLRPVGVGSIDDAGRTGAAPAAPRWRRGR